MNFSDAISDEDAAMIERQHAKLMAAVPQTDDARRARIRYLSEEIQFNTDRNEIMQDEITRLHAGIKPTPAPDSSA